MFVTRRLPDAGLAPLRETGVRLEVRAEDEAIARDELLRRAAGAAALVTLLGDRVDDELLDAAGPELRIVANYAVGLDNVDVDACSRRGVAVSNTPDVLTDATADHAFALLLAVARRLREGHDVVASGDWSGWQPMQLLGREIAGATLGIVGMGRIGRAVARRANGFGMHVLYHNRRPDPEAEAALGVHYAGLDDLLAASDVVSLHCPLTPETHHLIDERALRTMRRGTILVNTARGPVVDEAALVAALDSGHLFGAGLDVFEHEPEVHPGLLGRPNVVLAPHTGSATVTARTAMARACATAVRAVLSGGSAPNVVNAAELAARED
ncbi:MAG: D-glycerate dehydrogenase [Trueperaceae bacterium]